MIVAVAGRPVENWSQLMRKVTDLLDQPAEPGGAELLNATAHAETTNRTHLLIDGRHVVRLDFDAPATRKARFAPSGCAWARRRR